MSCWKCITDSRKPLMMACRCLEMPVPARNFASASASAAFTTMIFSASALSCAATRRRCAALISFMAIFTLVGRDVRDERLDDGVPELRHRLLQHGLHLHRDLLPM